MTKHKCLKCNHEWQGKVEKPKSCPRCKRYDWDVQLNKPGGKNGKPRET